MPFRFIFDIAFAMIIYFLSYVSIILLKKNEYTKKKYIIHFSKIFLFLSVFINLKSIISTILLDKPIIGFFNSNILIQEIQSLAPLVEYVSIILVNASILYFVVNKKRTITISEMLTYSIAIISIETSLSMYLTHFGGVFGLRVGITIFHILFCIIAILLYKKTKTQDIQIMVSRPESLLGLFSIGFFMMVYFGNGIYSLFGDNSIVVGSVLSIIYRGGVNPFLNATNNYSPISGFVSIVFTYLTGINNLLLSSTLPFFIGHLTLPFITYHFLKTFVTDDERIAMIGTVMTLVMDGLAVILLPTYLDNLTRHTINWSISPATKSLYNSSLNMIFNKPFNNLGTASAIAFCNIIKGKNKTVLLLSGSMFFLAFINQRQPFLAVLLLIFLFGIRKTNLKENIVIILSAIVSLGPIVVPIFYNTITNLTKNLVKMGLLQNEVYLQITNNLYDYVTYNNPYFLLVSIASLIGIIYSVYPNFRKKKFSWKFTSHYFAKKELGFKLRIGKTRINKILFNKIVFLILSFVALIYIILNAYGNLPSLFNGLLENIYYGPLNYMILRYHILIVLIIIGFIGIKFSKRTRITFTLLILLTYFGLFNQIILYAPLILVILAIPAFNILLKHRQKTETIVIISFVFLGVFSAFLYSGTITTTEPPLGYTDLPYALTILMNKDSDDVIYSASSYNYFVRRIASSMANIQLTSDPTSRVYMIDKMHTEITEIEQLLQEEIFGILYQGDRFLILERYPLSTATYDYGD